MLFREKGIMTASVLTAILIEALMPGGDCTAASEGFPPKDEKGLKE